MSKCDSKDKVYKYGSNCKIFIGLNDKSIHKQLISTSDALDIIRFVCLKYFSGFTISCGQGGYRDKFGQVYKENTIIVQTLNSDKESIEKSSYDFKSKLNQNSILIQIEEVSYDFLY